jgi:CRISPR/Cas system-associated exonuclease Cas4 (RecB family)
MIDVGAAVMAHKARGFSPSPHPNNRASEIGDDCERFLVLARTQWEDRKQPPPTLRCIFDLGNQIERLALRDLEEAGFEVIAQQQSFEDKRLRLSGSIDGMLRLEGRKYPLEIKGLSHHTWLKLNTMQDFLTAPQPWIHKYVPQLMTYMYLSDYEAGLFYLVSKQTGECKTIWITLDYDFMGDIVAKLERVNAHVDAGTLPEQIDDAEKCISCDFFHVCLPEIRRDAIHFDDDPDLAVRLARWWELRGAVKEYNALDKELKATLKEQEKALVGDFLVTGKWIDRKGYVVEDARYWRGKWVPLTPQEPDVTG